MNQKKPPTLVSLESLREKELSLQDQELESDFSDLNADQELDFEAYQTREYQPEVWEVENDDATNEDGDESL